MKPLCLALVLMLLTGLNAHAADPAVCNAAKTSFNRFLAAQPNACTTDAQCGTFYYGPETCDPPYVMANSHATASFSSVLLAQQEAVRTACETRKTTFPACSPTATFPICVKGRCVDRVVR